MSPNPFPTAPAISPKKGLFPGVVETRAQVPTHPGQMRDWLAAPPNPPPYTQWAPSFPFPGSQVGSRAPWVRPWASPFSPWCPQGPRLPPAPALLRLSSALPLEGTLVHMDLDAYPYRGPSPSVDTEIPHFWNPEVKISWHKVGIAEGSYYSDTRKWVPPSPDGSPIVS